MRTTVTLNEDLVRELVKYSDEKTKTAAVALAVKEQIRRAKLKKLSGLLGTINIDEKAIEESNEADMRRAQMLKEIGEGNGN
ncbi:MAG: type II toxin-antitoxin system VapB family antitoxin [Deltaproteobacteria bacterium]|nr:type II toxin-antitoxin system VapB family antitoxin [Deltaproteobacteria bacterium]MBW2247501.1 type II toxin-antitoxin system VapB family antitoxin [Deltaproteobacteria bacterium]MBW2680537.1 type II toxin-antitoxin system VapB family antitoxin [Deltaproteobacteria bacterium]